MLLDKDSIHVWCADQSGFSLAQLESCCLHWLSAEDRSLHSRLRIERHRIQMLLGRYLVRSVLSLYDDAVAPPDWRIVKNGYGKPALDPNQHTLPLYFNLSHSRGRLVVAVARQEALGIDIEGCLRERRIARIASRYFAPEEVKSLLSLPPERQLIRFYQLWTLKEAYIKARGLGLAIPLQQFSFCFDADNRIEVQFARQLADSANDWQFWQMDLGLTHQLALAIKRPSEISAMRVQFGYFDGETSRNNASVTDLPVAVKIFTSASSSATDP